MITFLSLLFFVVSVAFLVFIRTKSNGKYEIKPTDVVIGIIPIILWLLISGQILELGVGDLKVKLREAYQMPVSEQVTSLLEGTDLIVVGVDCISGSEDEIMNEKSFPTYKPFKFILLEENCEDDKSGDADAIFWGILSVDDYRELFLSPHSKLGGEQFIDWVKSRNLKKLEETVPSFLSANNAINLMTSKLTALENMEKLKTDFLPVLSEKKEFLGIIDRARVNSSFLIDVGKALNR